MKKELLLFAFLGFILLSGCQPTQYVHSTETAVPAETATFSSPLPTESQAKKYPPGQYLVGVDIPAGEYKLICEDQDHSCYYCVSKTALAKTGEIIAKDFFYNMAYVTIEDGQYLKLSYCYTEDSLLVEKRSLPLVESSLEPPAPVASLEPKSEASPAPSPFENTLFDSIFDEETAEKFDTAMDTQRKRQFILCITQEDLEGYCWGRGSAFTGLWQELFIANNLNGQWVLQDIKNDLDIYLALGSSSYDVLWIAGEAAYEAYDSGALKESMGEEEYQNFRDRMNAISKRLGILYDRPEYIPE